MNGQQRQELPTAKVESNWRRYLFWLIPVAAAALAGWVFYHELARKGPQLHIYFDNVEGLQAGNSKVKFRGVEIGKVDAVELTKDDQLARVTVTLERSAQTVARQGSLFWVVKPQIGLNRVTGLQTIMGGEFITVLPGSGKKQTEFLGVPEPPASQKEEPGLRVVLLGESLGSIKQHSPVLYRGVQVGEVHDSSLGPEAQTVWIYLDIYRKYAPLVRMNSRFWNAGGVNVSLGLSGLDISAQSVSTLITGGISFATPDAKEAMAYDGAAFRLYDKPQSAWLRWFPQIRLPLVQQSLQSPARPGRLR